MKSKLLKIALSLGTVFAVCGCNSEIDMVKNGTLQGHPETTVGKAIESVFGEVEWKFFETDKGVRVVEAKGFPGKQVFISNESYTNKREIENFCLSPRKFVMQFILYSNSNEFRLNYCGNEEGNPVNCDDIVYYIYHSSTKYEPMEETCKEVLAKKVEREARMAEERTRIAEEQALLEEEERLAKEKQKKLMEEAKASIETFKDPRDKKVYKTVKIGSQRWMAQNLNYKTARSYCYNNDADNCTEYGRLYVWEAAMKACPVGWHLPTKAELETLFDAVGGKSQAQDRLRTTSGWAENAGYGNVNGTDDFGFSALPAGVYIGESFFSNLGYKTSFWSATESNEDEEEGEGKAYGMFLGFGHSDVGLGSTWKDYAEAVRCIKD